ncbi:DUF1559 domain-containing protein [Calycomorphotria hydatis]|uniref:DUF1559 domain-containing protein n=1 Tax=Calycomorphotria hydatis TaxID=2528027 RepID=A0A517TD92_9PLAN|nr:DUF1559 domain-containing protein [Calycomorphotria hydatis]QDT66339.1 hypothetical protein V22_36050 [Calycomorphotria hydatis]
MSIPTRRAFTLVELLVVIAIISTLIALLLPAVQQAREAARRSHCKNNLKQVGLAIHNYHDNFGMFPIGSSQWGPGNVLQSDRRGYIGWAISILPFIEQQNLFHQYNSNADNRSSSNQSVREAFVNTYNCPSDPGTTQIHIPATGGCCGRSWAASSYRGVSGRMNPSNGAFWDDTYWLQTGGLEEVDRGPLGVIGYGFRPVRFRNITDGTSNTLLVGEATTITTPTRGTFWAHSYTSYALSSITVGYSAETFGITDYQACSDATSGGNPCKRFFGSLHVGGVQFVNCDGSVGFISENIDRELLGNLACIADGNVIGQF